MNTQFQQFNRLYDQIFQTTLFGGPGTGHTKCGDSDQHLMTLFALVLQTRAKNILELGVRYGDTSLPLAMGASITGGVVEAVDIEPTEWDCPEILKPHYKFHLSDAIDYLYNANKIYDIIYIDDWHTYPHVKTELELIDRLSDENTLILLHDLMGNNCTPKYFQPLSLQGTEWDEGGPFRAVNELNPDKWEWMTIPVNNGLTLLRKRSEIINF
jgi:predicted O-methyltransferase YrrM